MEVSADMISTPPSLVWLDLQCWGICFKPLGDARHLRASVGLVPPAQHENTQLIFRSSGMDASKCGPCNHFKEMQGDVRDGFAV